MITAPGGLGLFLLGMIVMTDGLRQLAGQALHRRLIQFTRTPISGAGIGSLSTAVLQSSSATTVATVGFVSAGLMSFHNALGIIFGANLGTTITGWMVALVGFKLQLGMLAMPLVLLGVLLKLFTRQRLAALGLALAGFGLIFVGIETLQQGMAGLSRVFDFSRLPGESLTGTLQLVVMGLLFTLVTQSSSAGVAATLSALFAGLIHWQQAAALVIGMDIATSVTAAIATLGTSVSARRTGLSHVLFNGATGLLALLLLLPYQWLLETLSPGILERQAELSLVGFHTVFNLLGVLLVLPFAHRFAAMMEHLVRDRDSPYTRQLDSALLQQPPLALTVAQQSASREFEGLLTHLGGLLKSHSDPRQVQSLQRSLNRTHDYLDLINASEATELERLKSLFHAMDHLQRLHERCEEEQDRARALTTHGELTRLHRQLERTLSQLSRALRQAHWQQAHWQQAQAITEAQHRQFEAQSQSYRDQVAERIARGDIEVQEGRERLEAIRWARRVSLHLARICHHLAKSREGAGIVED